MCVSSFPLKFGIGEGDNHCSIEQEIGLSGIGKEAIQAWHGLWARRAPYPSRKERGKKCAFLREGRIGHGCTYVSIRSMEGVSKGR